MNLYATPTEIKAAMPDGIRSTTTSYDTLIFRLADVISRYFDRYCRRVFYPRVGTFYFNGDGSDKLWIPDLISLTSLSYSSDDGLSYTTLTESGNFIQTKAGDYNDPRAADCLVLDANGDLSGWPIGQRSIKAIGVWAYADDKSVAWEDSLDTVENNPLTAAGTSITVNDADGVDLWGITPRFQAGHVLRIGTELLEVITVVAASTNTLAVLRGRNGSTAAIAAQNTQIDIWRPPFPVKQAAIIQAIRQMERGFQGFGDARATPDLGQLLFIKALDPEAQALLSPYRLSVI